MNGYKVIDFKNKVLSTTPTVINGVYEGFEGATKPILVSGIKISTTEYKPIFVEPYVSSGDYVFVAYGHTFAIDDDDKVTATAIE